MSTESGECYSVVMDNELIDLVRTVASAFQGRMQEQVTANGAGLTSFQGRLINLIGRHEGISQLTLASLLDRDKAQVARAIKELEASGLVIRRPHPSDWRAKCLALTEEGEKMHARLQLVRGQLAATVLGIFSDDEKHALRSSLEKMAAALRER